ncbi:MAG TPA: hypothetical protein DGG95_11235 [Cytophagales bacterium]|jgi:hypothetical protein|nr:hypothetical protein [Cytophagales bacterium]
MKKVLCLFLLVAVASACSPRLVENDAFVENLMKTRPAKFKKILRQKDTLGIQIIYTQINRDSSNRPTFKSFYFNVDSTQYFYPASTVKLPLVLLALEKLNQLNIHGLDKFTPMFHDSIYAGQLSVKSDTSAINKLPSVAHYAKKILVVSDNDAYNRLYEFVGQKEVNSKLKSKGYNIRILHRLERPLSPDQNRHTEAVRFVKDDSVIYSQPMLVNEDSIRPTRKVFKGKGYMSNDDHFISKPFDFTYKNFYPLAEQQEILKAVLFPETVDAKRKFDVTEADRQFVMQYMSQLPRETKHPKYRGKNYYDAYVKYLLFGSNRKSIPTHIRIFDKVGIAYGFMIDNAYIVDFKNNTEFMLSAVINTNVDGVYNDGKYEFDKIGFPFMKNLGRVVYKYELKRKKKYQPDLSRIKLKYEQ